MTELIAFGTKSLVRLLSALSQNYTSSHLDAWLTDGPFSRLLTWALEGLRRSTSQLLHRVASQQGNWLPPEQAIHMARKNTREGRHHLYTAYSWVGH